MNGGHKEAIMNIQGRPMGQTTQPNTTAIVLDLLDQIRPAAAR
jgi:hypothetical protein